MLLVKKCQIFRHVDLVKIRVEKMLNNFVEKEETFFLTIKTKIFGSPKSRIFPKGFTHAFGQKMPNFYLFLVKTRLEIRFNNVLDTKEPFFDYKRKILKVLKITFFQSG